MHNIKERQEFENYRKISLLGEGSFGKAFLVERASDNVSRSTLIENLFIFTAKMCHEINWYYENEWSREERNSLRI